jgi:apolipoprotein N-acyltransferase
VIGRNFMLGVVGGATGAVASVAGNFTRHDPHMVSTYPDGLSTVIAPLLIYLLVRILRRPKGSPTDVALGAGAIHGMALGAYTAWWLPIPSISLLAFAVAGSFLFAFLLAWAAAWAAWQPGRRFGLF